MKVNRTRDWLERVGWTAIYFVAGAFLAWAQSGDPWSWRTFGYGLAVAAAKVTLAQRVGGRGSGDAIPGGVTQREVR